MILNFEKISKATFILINFSRNQTEIGELQPIRNADARFWLVIAHRSGLNCSRGVIVLTSIQVA